MTTCINCKKESNLISKTLGICLECIRKDFTEVSGHIKEVHKKTRRDFNLPLEPPKDSKGIGCELCVNECKIAKGEKGYCGLRKNVDGKLLGPTKFDRSIPYSLLGFAPNFYMSDLPCTSRRHAQDCKSAAEKAGLINVNIGNRQLLGEDYIWS